MPRDDSAYLLDMLLAARDALSFTEGCVQRAGPRHSGRASKGWPSASGLHLDDRGPRCGQGPRPYDS